MSDNGNKKPSSRVGCVVGIVIVFMMLVGFLLIINSGKSESHSDFIVMLGIAFFLLPMLGVCAMTLIPQKVRGVKESPKKERVLQNLMMLSVIMTFGGFFGAFAAGISDYIVLAVVFGIIAGVGFISVFIVSAVNKRVTGNSGMTIELFPNDPEQEKKDMDTAHEVINEIFKKEARLSDEEYERELAKIEQNTTGGVPMTKEQVEEYEDRRNNRKR